MKTATKTVDDSNNKTMEVPLGLKDKVKEQSPLEHYAKIMICEPWLYLRIINHKVV